jgi:hypothetical protein|tara:strand:- start:3299 stop:3580 length:282 start_codon:yes stop_codon:yes gene_type:complete
MDFYKKIIFSILAFIFCFAVMIKLVEPVIERQFSNIFADKKLSKKLMKEFVNSTEDFTPEKRELYKNLIKKIYLKWVPLLDEVKREANQELDK